MLILDKPRTFDGQRILVPLYHRGHLSLFPGAKVWMCLLPGSSDERTFPELVVSPIHFDSWSDLWRISIALHERAGLVNDTFEILKDNALNILAAESSCMERQSLHVAEIIVDAKRYSGHVDDGSHEERSAGRINELAGLRRTILAQLLDDISFDPEERPRIKIRRVRNLFEARQAFGHAQEQVRLKGGPRPVVKDTTLLTATDGAREASPSAVIQLPSDVGTSLRQALRAAAQSPDTKSSYLHVSETTDRFLRAFFFRAGYPILAPTMVHKEEVGALAAITQAIQQAGFNIITSISRLYEYGAEARTEFVLQPISKQQIGRSEVALKEALEEALATPELADFYGLGITYERSYRSPLQTRKIEARRREASDSLRQEPKQGEDADTTESLLAKHYQIYKQRCGRPTSTPLDRMRFSLASSLWAEETASAAIGRPLPLFISFAFKDEARVRRIKNSARGLGFDVVTGQKLGADSTNREGIRRLMHECTCFLGVWSEEGGLCVHGDLWWPSPWLLWELGMAEAIGLRWRLLISEKIDPEVWKKLVPDTPHTIFSPGDFDAKFREALKNLRALARSAK